MLALSTGLTLGTRAVGGATPTPTPLPVNITPPEITGTAQEDETLTASGDTWTNSPTSRTYQWKADGGNIGTDADTFTLTASEVGKLITVTVVAINAGGASAPAVSEAVGPVAPAEIPMPTLTPGPTWTGTAGSGAAAPTDPTRTTAKPVIRPLIEGGITFHQDRVFGVHAYAKGGISKVRFHCEGSTVDVSAISKYDYTDANGVARSVWGYFVTLDPALWLAIATGTGNIYAEAFANDGTMQTRVIGPFAFAPTLVEHDFSIAVAASGGTVAGVTYPTFSAAFAYLKAQSAQHPKITVTETGTYDPGDALIYTGGKGYCTVTHAPGVVCTIARATLGSFRPRYSGLRYRGSGIRVDMKNCTAWINETNYKPFIFDGTERFKSDGQFALRGDGLLSPTVISPTGAYICLEEYVHDTTFAWIQSPQIVRNCTGARISGDVAQIAYNIYGLTVSEIDPAYFRVERDALTVQYAGTGTGTVAKTGTNGSTSGVLTLNSNGTPTNIPLNAGSITIADLVTSINAVSGWTATAGADAAMWPAIFVTKPGAVGGGAFTATDAKTAPLALVTMVDAHCDISQPGTGGTTSNVVNVNVSGLDLHDAQNIFFNTSTFQDCIAANFACFNQPGDVSTSQQSTAHSHVLVYHNSLANQGMLLRTPAFNPDTYCETSANVFRTYTWLGSADADMTSADNHVVDTSGNFVTSTNGTTGGSVATLWTDAAAGDFTPIGSLAAKTITPLIPFDVNNAARGSATHVGAVA